MARRSTAATPTSAKSHKRQISQSTATPGTRSSKRVKDSLGSTPGSSTPKKSKYFEGSDDDVDVDDGDEDEVSHVSEESDFEDEEIVTEDSPVQSETEEESNSEEDVKPKRKKGQSGASVVTIGASRQLWREGVKTGLGPGKQVFIEKPKPRGDGGIKYVPDRIHPNSMLFLADLKKNNDREWLKMHDPDFRQSWRDWESYVDTLSGKISEVDETVPELPPKDLVFRIYRDVRFSKDPTPYKPHFSAAWSRTGRKGPFACYYVQVSPHGKSFVGGGLWMPEAQQLALLRNDINNNPHKIRKVLTDEALRKHIFGGLLKDEKKAIKAFVAKNQENALKTKPKGYEADNPNIDLLRLRNFTIGKNLSEEDLLDHKSVSKIMTIVTAMVPFITYLNSIVMPDDDGSSSEGSQTDSGDDAEE